MSSRSSERQWNVTRILIGSCQAPATNGWPRYIHFRANRMRLIKYFKNKIEKLPLGLKATKKPEGNIDIRCSKPPVGEA